MIFELNRDPSILIGWRVLLNPANLGLRLGGWKKVKEDLLIEEKKSERVGKDTLEVKSSLRLHSFFRFFLPSSALVVGRQQAI